ncbi:MAG: SPOR domain-containing protein [Gammaproteobacteria bacterium]|nr:SPOR domain-containing protein [Gammaproteobacteria bacterium]
MANYQDKQHSRKQTRGVVTRRQSRQRFLMGIMVTFLGGYTLAWFYPPMVLTTWFQSYLGSHKYLQQPVKTAELPKPKFEFYTLLTQEKAPLKSKSPAVNEPTATLEPVKIPEPIKAVEPTRAAESVKAVDSVKNDVPAAPIQALSKYTYLLQLASFQRREDAEQMKASLIMRGLDASIKTATQQGGVWHRVVMGPFESRQTAEKIQANIAQSERISGIIRRVDV